jgi:hypothetical protein
MTRPPLYDEIFEPGALPYRFRPELLPDVGSGGSPGYGLWDEGSLYVPVRLNNMISADGAYTVIPPGYTHGQLQYSQANVSSGALVMSLVYETGSISMTAGLQDIAAFAGKAVKFTYGTMPSTLDAVFLTRFTLDEALTDQHPAYCPIHLEWGKQVTSGFFVVPPFYEHVELVSAQGSGTVSSVRLSLYTPGSGATGTAYTVSAARQHIPAIAGKAVVVEFALSTSFTQADILLAFYKA